MRYLIKVGYRSQEEVFNLDYLTSRFKAKPKYPKKMDTDLLKPIKEGGLFIPNKKANVLENSWQIVELADEIKKQFYKLLKSENEEYLYRHYSGGEGKFSNPIVRDVGSDNKYIIELVDLFYPTYDEKGKITEKTIEKHIYSFEMDASVFLPIRSNSYKPDLKSTYKNKVILKIGNKSVEDQGVINTAKAFVESNRFENRFDTIAESINTTSSLFA